MSGEWYVCYCEPKKSIKLAEALRARGDRAECPSFEFRRRVPRKQRTELLLRPLIGGIIFIGVESWPLPSGFLEEVDLSRLRQMMTPSSPAVVKDEELDGLRMASAEKSHKKKFINRGDSVEICLGPLKGMEGIVAESYDDIATVDLGGLFGRVEIAAFLLRKNQA